MHEHNHVVFIVWFEEISIPTPSWRVIGNFLRGKESSRPKSVQGKHEPNSNL